MSSGGGKRRRRPLLAAFLSGLFPGLGQLYCGARRKALLFFVAGVATSFWPINPLAVEIDLADPVPGLEWVLVESLPFLVVALWSVVDAYRDAARSAPFPS